MIVSIVTLLYILVGVVIASWTAYENRGGPWPPEIQGFMVVMALWLPALIFAVVKTERKT